MLTQVRPVVVVVGGGVGRSSSRLPLSSARGSHRNIREYTTPQHIFIPSVLFFSLLVVSFPLPPVSPPHLPYHSFRIRRSFNGTECSGSKLPRRTLRWRSPCSPDASLASAVTRPRGRSRGHQALPAGRLLRRGRGRRSRRLGGSAAAGAGASERPRSSR